MATRISTCTTCSSPIYDADGVADACGCSDGLYLTLLARARLQNRVRRASAAQALPALPPDLFDAPTGPLGPSAEDPGFEVEFDFGADVAFDDPPTHYVAPEARFRVDRPPPLPQRFTARGIEPGPQGGPMREAAQVRGFTVLREVPTDNQWTLHAVVDQPAGGSVDRPTAEILRQRESAHSGASPARTSAEKRLAAALTGATVYDKLTKGFLDDD